MSILASPRRAIVHPLLDPRERYAVTGRAGANPRGWLSLFLSLLARTGSAPSPSRCGRAEEDALRYASGNLGEHTFVIYAGADGPARPLERRT